MVSSNSCKKHDIRVRKARIGDAQGIYEVLSQSFEPYSRYYTEKAYKATVISVHEIENRINGQKTEVLVAIHDSKIVGTASIKIEEKAKLHIRSMAVIPSYQGRGIGRRILKRINELAKQKNCKTVSLECFEPLTKAVTFYEACGFRRTGRKRNYHGITIFEMTKCT